jgi:predicted PurR-regulated permease PerM
MNENSNTESKKAKQESPKWNWTTKLLVGLTLVAISLWLLVQFQNFLGPLITALILAYLIQPIAQFLKEKLKFPWQISVTLVYLLLVGSVLGLLTWGGFALFEQFQSLIRFIERNLDQLPELVAEITEQTYQIGPFSFTPTLVELDNITDQIVGAIQPLLGRMGSFAGAIAAGAVSVITWVVLIFLVSYFLLAESEGIPGRVLNINIPGYSKDMERISKELKRIWQGFLRGEILVVLISMVLYTITLGAMGVQFFIGLSTIAAVGQLIPYVGAWATWISFGLVALFQNTIPFGLPPGVYTIIVLGVGMIINNIIDQIIRTKVMAESLKVHPALVLIGALIGVQLFGFVGIIIAAPVMASFKLFLNYIIKKLNDQNPWEDLEVRETIESPKWLTFFQKTWGKLTTWIKQIWNRVWNKREDIDKSNSSLTQKNEDTDI